MILYNLGRFSWCLCSRWSKYRFVFTIWPTVVEIREVSKKDIYFIYLFSFSPLKPFLQQMLLYSNRISYFDDYFYFSSSNLLASLPMATGVEFSCALFGSTVSCVVGFQWLLCVETDESCQLLSAGWRGGWMRPAVSWLLAEDGPAG